MRLAAQAKAGFYPTPPRVVEMIAELVSVYPGRYRNLEVVRLLDPCCGAGEALAQLGHSLSQRWSVGVETSGVELHQDRAQQASERLTRALGSDLFTTSIANGAFGVLLLNPPYDWALDEKKRVEHSFLVHCTRYLYENGVLVFIVPKARLAVSARHLASHYRALRCWAFPEPEVQAFNQVVLMGYRKTQPNLDDVMLDRIRDWSEGELEPLYPTGYPAYQAPMAAPGDILFTTRTVDPVAAATEAKSPVFGPARRSPTCSGPPMTTAPGR